MKGEEGRRRESSPPGGINLQSLIRFCSDPEPFADGRRAHYKEDLSSLLFIEQKTHPLTSDQLYTVKINYTAQINTSEETVWLFSLLTGDFV